MLAGDRAIYNATTLRLHSSATVPLPNPLGLKTKKATKKANG